MEDKQNEQENNIPKDDDSSLRLIELKIPESLRRSETEMQPSIEMEERMAEKMIPYVEMQARMTEVMRPVLEMQARIAEAMQPVLEMQARMAEAMRPVLEMQARIYQRMNLVVKVSNRLGDYQFVFWEYLGKQFIDEILGADDVNACLLKKYAEDSFKHVNNTIKNCRINEQMKPYKNVFSQAISAYRKKHYELSTLGLLSIADGMLSDISGILTHRFDTRAKMIMEKVKSEELLPYEYSLIILALTFEKTINTMWRYCPFNEEEPILLNRNWIIHGRYRRTIIQLDCIKLLNLLYGLILIGDFDKMGID